MGAAVTAENHSNTGRGDRTARSMAAVCAVVGAVALVTRGVPGLIGFLYGAAITLVVWRGIRIVVRACLKVDVPLRKAVLAVLLVLKLPVLVLLPAGAAWLIVHRIADPFALVGGIAAIQGVILVKALDARALALMPQETVEALLGINILAAGPVPRVKSHTSPVPEGSDRPSFRLSPAAAHAPSGRRAEGR